jgi:hypothetical protein
MGKTIVKLKLTNLGDLLARDRKLVKGEPRLTETEALVDRAATSLALKPSVIKALGLRKLGLTRFDGHPERAGRGFMV